MSVHMVESKIQAGRVGDVQAAAEKMFAALREAGPDGVRYGSCLAPDGETFIALVQVDEGVDSPVPALPEFQEFVEVVELSRAGPATIEPLTLVGSYRLF
jgi:hypothetical protein